MFEKGFVVERPAIVIPWRISEERLVEIIGPEALTHVTRGYYTAGCIALGGLQIALGFHFQPRRVGQLREFEVFRTEPHDLAASYDEFQAHLVALLGPPTHTQHDVDSGFDHHEWRHWKFHVLHYVLERFAPEDHVRARQ